MLNVNGTLGIYLQASILALGWAALSGLPFLWRKEVPDALHALLRGHLLVVARLDSSLESSAPGAASSSRRLLPSQIYPLDDDRPNPRGLALEGCPDCEGDGYWNCSTCDGEGEDEDGNTCEDCDGRGYVTCETCDGYGTLLSL